MSELQVCRTIQHGGVIRVMISARIVSKPEGLNAPLTSLWSKYLVGNIMGTLLWGSNNPKQVLFTYTLGANICGYYPYTSSPRVKDQMNHTIEAKTCILVQPKSGGWTRIPFEGSIVLEVQ